MIGYIKCHISQVPFDDAMQLPAETQGRHHTGRLLGDLAKWIDEEGMLS